MESGHRAPEAVTDRFTWRARLVASCIALIALAFAQSSGRIVTDTKLDLVVAPWNFLQRALAMWDDQAAFGQLQNQGYGYLFPMGPFFGIFDSLGIPDWVTQRLWWSLVLVVAFLGVVKLCSLLDIGSPWARILAGFAFALSPRMISVIGPSSIEVWPSAVAPWVLIPLIVGLRRGSPRRYAALSALAVACVGGVNAAASFAVIPLGALWLLLAQPSARRRALMIWWPALTLAATLWWLVPLFLLGGYSPPFLDYIESIDNTSFSATIFDTLRGTSNWVPYIDSNAAAGRDLVSEPLIIANSVVVLCFGLIGLSRADTPYRKFLVAGLVVGLLAVTIGHAGAVAGWFSDEARTLLDGALAPLRNTHKFDVLLRLPLVLGLCHAVTALSRTISEGRSWEIMTARFGPAVLAVVAVAGSTVPAWTGALAPNDSFDSVPDYWTETADWLGENQNGRALLAPATPFGDYSWGKTADEPMQPLASGPWAVRNLVPLAPGGNIVALDTITNQLATGQGSQAFAAYLKRMGVGTIVLRHDIDRGQGTTNPELVRNALVSTPGMQRAASFGPEVGGGARYGDDEESPFISAGWQTPRPAVEVFSLVGKVADTSTQEWSETPALIGDSDSLLAADEWDVTRRHDVMMAPDVPAERTPESVILSDGNRRQEQAFGAVVRQRSATLTDAEPFRQDRRVWRYDQEKLNGWLTTPRVIGAESITASSSRSDVGATPTLDQASLPWAAFDSDAATAWRPDRSDVGEESWIRVRFGRERDLGDVSIRLQAPPSRSTTLKVATEQGEREVRVQGQGPATINVGRVRALTIRGTESTNRELAITEVSSPELSLSRTLRLPPVPDEWGRPDSIIVQSAREHTDGCAVIADWRRCAEQEEYAAEGGRTIDREVKLPEAAEYDVAVRAQPYGGTALDELLQSDQVAQVSASSQVTEGAGASAVRAIDGDSQSGWVANSSDDSPSYTVRWVGERRVSSLELESSDDLAASVPTQVRLVFSDGSSVDAPVEDEKVEFPAVETSQIQVQITGTEDRSSLGFDGSITKLPVGFSEIAVDGLDLRFFPDQKVKNFACGSGPSITARDRVVKTRVRASLAALSSGDTVNLQLCGSGSEDPIELREGLNRLIVGGSPAFRPTSALLTAADAAAPSYESAADEQDSDSALYITTHNANAGWGATQDGETLSSETVNGWQQAWFEGSFGRVMPSFEPQNVYRYGIGVGVLTLLAVFAVAMVGQRRPSDGDTDVRPSRRGWLRRAVPVMVLGAGGVLASWAGLAVAAVALVAVWATDGRREWLRAWLIGGSVIAAGVFYVVGPWAGFGGWAGSQTAPQLLGIFAVLCVVSLDARRPAFLNRIAGFSTTR